MRKAHEVAKMFLEHTPAYTRGAVEKNLKMCNFQAMNDKKMLEPMTHYLLALEKHRDYHDFFQIGVVRDQKKKIANVAKYVGLAIKDFSYIHEAETDRKQKLEESNRQEKQNKEAEEKKSVKYDASIHSQIIQSWVFSGKVEKQEEKDPKVKVDANEVNKK